VHFYIGDLAAASTFYHRGLGFDQVVWTFPGALFVSAAGYHHHVGLNIWAAGSPVATDADARVLRWDLVLPDARSVEAAEANLTRGGIVAEKTSDGVYATDPWGITVRVIAA